MEKPSEDLLFASTFKTWFHIQGVLGPDFKVRKDGGGEVPKFHKI